MKLLPLLCLSAVALDEVPGDRKRQPIPVPSYTPARFQQAGFNEQNFRAEYEEQVSGNNFMTWLRSIRTSEHATDKINWLQSKPQTLRFNGENQINNINMIFQVYPIANTQTQRVPLPQRMRPLKRTRNS